MHKFAFYFSALLALVCSILSFVESAASSCPNDGGSCLSSSQRAVTIVVGVLWLLFGGLTLKLSRVAATGDDNTPSFSPETTGESA